MVKKNSNRKKIPKSKPETENRIDPSSTNVFEISDESKIRLIQTLQQFTGELNHTFPELNDHLSSWLSLSIENKEWDTMLLYLFNIFPEHFFNILFKNESMFLEESIYFLPNIDFSILFKDATVTEGIREVIWSYLQTILFEIVQNIKDKTQFKDAVNLFNTVPEEELNEQLSNAYKSCAHLFSDQFMEEDELFKEDITTCEESKELKDQEASASAEKNTERMKSILEKIIGSKIGSLSSTIFDELRPEIKEMFPDMDLDPTAENSHNTGLLFRKLIQNPKKLMPLLKKVSERVELKIKTGEINRDELLSDLSDLVKGKDGKGGFQDILKEMSGQMGFSSNFAMNHIQKELKNHQMRERMRRKQEERKNVEAIRTTFRVDDDHEQNCSKRPMTDEELEQLIKELETDQKTTTNNSISNIEVKKRKKK